MTAVILDLLVRSALLIGAAGIATAAIGRAGGSAASRHLAWLLGFGGLALLPLLSAIVPALPLPVLPAVPEPSVDPVLASQSAALPVGAGGTDSVVSIADLLLLAYVAVAALLLLRPVAGRILLARMWRDARPVDDPETLALVDRLARSFAIRRRVAVGIASGPTVPMTWGVLRPRVLLPANARRWSSEQFRLVLLHELGHIARHDSATWTAAAVLCALYWPNPLVWLAAERMRREQEHACDDLVLSNGAEAGTYARSLLGTARALPPKEPVMSFAAAIVRRSDLERRLSAIVADLPRKRAGAAFAAVGAIATLGFTGLMAAAIPVAAASPAPLRAVQAGPPVSPIVVPRAPQPAAVTSAVPAAAPIVSRPASVPARPAPVSIPDRAAVAAMTPAEEYEQALARYRQEKTAYEAAIVVYRAEREQYRRKRDAHRQEVAEYRRRVEAIRALPEGDPGKIIPPAPVAPVAPVAPAPPVVPPLPHAEPDHS
jgi:beta-lactamase regulating signal transducer with metallopeptidase domain